MRRTRLFSKLPSAESIRDSRFLRPLSRYLHHHFLWQFNRASVARGAAIGLFFGILIPFGQIFVSAVFAILLRGNLPIAAFATFISNPFTFPAIYYIAFKIGEFIVENLGLSDPLPLAESAAEEIPATSTIGAWFSNLLDSITGIGLPMMVGLSVLSVTFAVIGYLLVTRLWRLYSINRWRKRIQNRAFKTSPLKIIRLISIERRSALIIGLVSFVLIAVLDVLTSSRVSLLLLQLIPVLFVTWYADAVWGAFFAVALAVSQAVGRLVAEGQSVLHIYSMLDIASDLIATLFLVWLLSQLKTSYEQINRLARHDALTHSLNRNGFYEAVEVEIERCSRYSHHFSLIYFDCDNFKYVNDSLGHQIGDQLLMAVASTLSTNLRSIDVHGRLGGDEFAVLLVETEADAARKTVEHVQEKLDASMRRKNWPVTFSIGVATFETVPKSVDRVIECADLLMYEVKNNGKNSILTRSFTDA